jgi:ketosteroid isomerase-like protein
MILNSIVLHYQNKNQLIKMKQTVITCLFIFSFMGLMAQNKKADEVKQVLATYKKAMENLDYSGAIGKLFTEDAMVYENGDPGDKVADFLKEHLHPELEMFQSFTYHNYQSSVIVSGDYAFTTETYEYTIVLKKDGKPIVPSSMGVVTAVLKKTGDGWKFISFHSSYRKQKLPK